jgi:RecG-like helicase
MVTEQRSRLRQVFSRIVVPQAEVRAEEEQERAVALGGTPVSQLRLRERATVCGTLRSVVLRPRAGAPTLEAELYDGSGSVVLVWLGRRHIAGIVPGRSLRVSGMITNSEGKAAMFNPRYELLPKNHG